MPIHKNTNSEDFYAVCDYCKKQSDLVPESMRITLMLLAEKYGWFVTEDGSYTYCCEEHLDAHDLDDLEKILREYEPRTD